MAWTVRPDGAVDFLNQRWLDFTGLTLEEEIEKPTLARITISAGVARKGQAFRPRLTAQSQLPQNSDLHASDPLVSDQEIRTRRQFAQTEKSAFEALRRTLIL